MPQLVKGGKHVFGWSCVGDDGRIAIPPEALQEYRLGESQRLLVLPGSQTSGGFGLAAPDSIRGSPLGARLQAHGSLWNFRGPGGTALERGGRTYSWVQLRNGSVTIPPATLEKYGIKVGDRLLVIRGSGRAVGFAVRGPIVAEANRHCDLAVSEP